MNKIKKAVLISAGVLCVVLGFIGIFIPILPTTPFLLLAAFFFTRSSNRALHWLENNRWFGKYIRNYRAGLGMPAREKVVTLTLLWLTIGFSAIFLIENGWVRMVLFVVAVGVTAHLMRIKTYRPEV
jgi:uncharacterized protein